jgi:hypothetical protein
MSCLWPEKTARKCRPLHGKNMKILGEFDLFTQKKIPELTRNRSIDVGEIWATN